MHLRLALIVALLSLPLVSLAAAPVELRVRSRIPITLDWNFGTSVPDQLIADNIMEGLFRFDDAMKPQLALARSYQVSADGKTYTFRLREGVKWSDGAPLTAQQFVDSWQRMLDPLQAREDYPLLDVIVGAADFRHHKLEDFSKVGIRAIDAATIELKIRYAQPSLPAILAVYHYYPIRKDLIDRYGPSWAKPGKLAVLGPYVPTALEGQNRLVLERNARYYDRPPSIDRIVFTYDENEAAALAAFKAGKLDLAMNMEPAVVGELSRTPSYVVLPAFSLTFLAFDRDKFPVDQLALRKAIALALDRSKLSEAAHVPLLVQNSMLAPQIFPEGKDLGLRPDAKAAREQLARTGLKPESLPPLEILTYSSVRLAYVANFIADELRKTLGLRVEVKMVALAKAKELLELRSNAMSIWDYGADYPDVGQFLGLFLSGIMGSKGPDYDLLLEKLQTTPAGPALTALYREVMERLLVKDVALVPLFCGRFNHLVSRRLQGFRQSALGIVHFDHFRVQ